MNYLIQRGKVRSQFIKVPEGFPELLSDITREVLRCQPIKECLCQFIIDYLQSVIVAREKAMTANIIIERALKKVDEIISDICICDIDKLKAEEMAIAMEDCFRSYLNKRRCQLGKNIDIIKFGEEDMLDELIKRCKFTLEEQQTSRPIIEESYKRLLDVYMSTADKTGGTEALYQYFKERELLRKKNIAYDAAAVKIQALFRGFMVRKSQDRDKSKLKGICSAYTFDNVHKRIADEAATKIQSFFKKHYKHFEDYYYEEEEGHLDIDQEDSDDFCETKSDTAVDLHSTQPKIDELPGEPAEEIDAEKKGTVKTIDAVKDAAPTVDATEEPAEPAPEPTAEPAAIEPEPVVDAAIEEAPAENQPE